MRSAQGLIDQVAAGQRRRGAAARARARDRGRGSSPASPAAPRWPARSRSPRRCPPGTNIFCMLPDTGRALPDHAAVRGHPAEMTDEEIEHVALDAGLSLRRPRGTLAGSCRASVRPGDRSMPPAAAFVRAMQSPMPGEPVVLFALEWCEFCWSVRKLFARLGIPFRSIDLDSVDYQHDDLGGTHPHACSRRAPADDAFRRSSWAGESRGRMHRYARRLAKWSLAGHARDGGDGVRPHCRGRPVCVPAPLAAAPLRRWR